MHDWQTDDCAVAVAAACLQTLMCEALCTAAGCPTRSLNFAITGEWKLYPVMWTPATLSALSKIQLAH